MANGKRCMQLDTPKETQGQRERIVQVSPQREREIADSGRQGAAEWVVGSEGPGDFPDNCHISGEKGHNAVKCGKANGLGHGKKGVLEVDDETIEKEGPYDLGDSDLCAVDEVWEACILRHGLIADPGGSSGAQLVLQQGGHCWPNPTSILLLSELRPPTPTP